MGPFYTFQGSSLYLGSALLLQTDKKITFHYRSPLYFCWAEDSCHQQHVPQVLCIFSLGLPHLVLIFYHITYHIYNFIFYVLSLSVCEWTQGVELNVFLEIMLTREKSPREVSFVKESPNLDVQTTFICKPKCSLKKIDAKT